MHIGRCFSPTRRTRVTVESAVSRERGVVGVVRGEGAICSIDERQDDLTSTNPMGSHQLPSTSMPLDRPQWPRLYGTGLVGELTGDRRRRNRDEGERIRNHRDRAVGSDIHRPC